MAKGLKDAIPGNKKENLVFKEVAVKKVQDVLYHKCK